MRNQSVKFCAHIGHSARNHHAAYLGRRLASFHDTHHTHWSAHHAVVNVAWCCSRYVTAQVAGTPMRGCRWLECAARYMLSLIWCGHKPAPQGFERGDHGDGLRSSVHGNLCDGRVGQARSRTFTSAWCCESGRRPGPRSRKAHRDPPRWFGNPDSPDATQSGCCAA